MLKIRVGGGGNDDNNIGGFKVRDDEDPENSKSSLSNPTFSSPQSRPNLEPDLGGAKLSWPSTQLHIPGSSDKVP